MSTSAASPAPDTARLHSTREAVALRTGRGEVMRSWEAPPGSELDPMVWSRAAQDCRAEATTEDLLEGVTAVVLSGDLDVHVITDAQGAPLRSAFCGPDARMEPDARWLLGQLPGGAEEWTALTGEIPHAGRLIARCSWMHRSADEPWAEAGRLCSLPEWLATDLIGAPVHITAEMAAASGFWSIRDQGYSRLICAVIDAERALEATLGPVGDAPGGVLGTWDGLAVRWA